MRHPPAPGPGAPPPWRSLRARTIDTEGRITAVRSNEFDVVVFDLENSAMASTALTVRYGSTTVFRRLSASTVTVGAFVELKGELTAGVITATKVELG